VKNKVVMKKTASETRKSFIRFELLMSNMQTCLTPMGFRYSCLPTIELTKNLPMGLRSLPFPFIGVASSEIDLVIETLS